MGCVLVKAEGGACKRECLRVTPAPPYGIRVCSKCAVKCLDPQKDQPVLWKESVADIERTRLSIWSFSNKWVFYSLTLFSYSLLKSRKGALTWFWTQPGLKAAGIAQEIAIRRWGVLPGMDCPVSIHLRQSWSDLFLITERRRGV